MRGVDGGVRSNCHRSSVSHSRVTNVPPPAGAHLIVDVEESDTEDSGPPPLPTDLHEESEGEENSIPWMRLKCLLPRNQLSDSIHTQHGQVHTQLVLHSATLQGEGRWAGLGDAIDQVREWRDVCTVNSGLLAKLQELAIH